jgi:hypothetical protein
VNYVPQADVSRVLAKGKHVERRLK